MIQATIFRGAGKGYRGFRIEGHAGYAKSGSDIVCAAVSVLAINTVNAIERFTDDAFTADTDEAGGFLLVSFADGVSERSQLLLDTMVLGLQSIADDGETAEYVDIRFEEV